ncbi:MAG: DUF1232 domain-containing protein [Candidatus Poribacteria bacterium]|nr:DUF1232 domain-containing protein [Candidatus Poribacteria bacterium]
MFQGGPVTGKIARIVYHAPNFVRLFWRLWNDPRVPVYRKGIPVVSGFVALIVAMVYFAARVDLIPDFIPFIGKADDLLLLMGLVFAPGAWGLIRFSPSNIVVEHIQSIDESNRKSP